jgi:serine/threonine protein kinase
MATELADNDQLGSYRIEERIGAGGMGVVYRATDTKLGRTVALKVIRPELLHAESLTRFEREARLLASLNHAHIATIHGMEESGGQESTLSFPRLTLRILGMLIAARITRGDWSCRLQHSLPRCGP